MAMGRPDVLQISGIDSKLLKRIDNYKEDENLKSRSEAGRALIEFALRVIDHAEANEGVTTRELMEEILRVSSLNSKMLDNIYFQTFDEFSYKRVEPVAIERKKIAKDRAEHEVEDFLSGNKSGA
ncbi:hypothetical protein [Photobacterium sp. R1]